MNTVKKPIEDASDAELRTFATTTLQLELADSATRAQILGAMSKVHKQPFINIAEDTAPMQAADADAPKVKREAKNLTHRYQDDPVVECVVAKTSYVGGEEPAAPNVNGVQLVIPRDILVKIPYRFYLALKDSHEDITRPNDRGQPVTTRINNFPMSDVVMPPKAEIEAWFERTKDKVLG